MPECPTFDEERARFRAENPEVERVELLLVDSCGVPRGKWIPIGQLDRIARAGMRLPESTHAETVFLLSRPGPGTGVSFADRDAVCRPVAGTLRRVPWGRRPSAQLLMRMTADDEGHISHALDPRGILEAVEAKYRDQGLTPVAAVELECMLFRKTDRPGAPPEFVGRLDRNRLYEIAALEDLEPFLDAVRLAGEALDIPITGVTSEMAPGQIELNLSHVPGACRAADLAVLFKRMVKRIARDHGFDATFMAKPLSDAPGSGCHVHLSLQAGSGANWFDEPNAAPGLAGTRLRKAIRGLLDTALASQLILAPFANSYRRFLADSFAPTRIEWGYDHRRCALRVPTAKGVGARLEHRIAGADAQPYLLLAAMLGGVSLGLAGDALAPAPLRSDQTEADGPELSTSWLEAIQRFESSDFIRATFGETFQRAYANMKRLEREQLALQVPETELRAYYHRA